MPRITVFQLYLLRAMYLLVVIGLSITIWPEIIFPSTRTADAYSVIHSFLGAMTVLSFLGLRYPLQMLPVLLFELIWKTMWVIFYAIPAWMTTGLDTYAADVLFACTIGIVLTPIAIPWRYVIAHYVKSAGGPWRKSISTGIGLSNDPTHRM